MLVQVAWPFPAPLTYSSSQEQFLNVNRLLHFGVKHVMKTCSHVSLLNLISKTFGM